MIKNIIFDMGNVLLDYNPEVSLNCYCKSEEAKNLIRRELFRGEEWIQGDLGNISNAERYELVAPRIPEQYREELKAVVDHWYICMLPLPHAKEYVQMMRDAGYHLYVLSNACALFYEYFPKQFELSLFDGIVVSSDLHIIKPDARIYQYILDKYKLEPSECLFIDDVERNVESAREQGMYGFVFRNSYEDVTRYIEVCREGHEILPER